MYLEHGGWSYSEWQLFLPFSSRQQTCWKHSTHIHEPPHFVSCYLFCWHEERKRKEEIEKGEKAGATTETMFIHKMSENAIYNLLWNGLASSFHWHYWQFLWLSVKVKCNKTKEDEGFYALVSIMGWVEIKFKRTCLLISFIKMCLWKKEQKELFKSLNLLGSRRTLDYLSFTRFVTNGFIF